MVIDIVEDLEKDLEKFISYWEDEAESFKDKEITKDDSRDIMNKFIFNKEKFDIFLEFRPGLASLSDYRKLGLLESRLHNSLAIARSNFRSKHKTIWERLVDSIGGMFHIFNR